MAETCPKCGYPQVETDECPRCRVIISQYRAYLQRLGQPPAAVAPTAPPRPGAAPPPPVEGGVWPEGSPGGFWIRGAALIVDSLVLNVAAMPFVLLIVLPTLLVGGISQPPSEAFAFAVNAGYNVVLTVGYAAYYVWMHGRWGQTLGKMATGVRVVKANGEAIGYGRAFGRLLGALLSALTLGIGYLIAGVRADKRALHDLVAGTRVIKVQRPWLEGRPSGFWMRYLAVSVDGYVIVLPFIGVIGIFAAVMIPVMAAGGGQAARAFVVSVFVAVILFLIVLMAGYNIWMHGKWGQTLGKMALGMKVVRVDGSPLGYGKAFLRWIGSLLSWMIFMIGFIMAGLRSDKRALHDLIAGSRVTYIR